jgi:hypothetical protein
MWYSTLDLTAGYHQVPLGENIKDKSAFITESGLYQWNVMAFGLTNAPATFQRMFVFKRLFNSSQRLERCF